MKVLVVLHIFYPELADYYFEKLGNIHSCEWDLVVTGSSLDYAILEKARKVNPSMSYFEVPNIGFDVWPFIQCIKNTDLSKYDWIIKLHTKKEDDFKAHIHTRWMNGREWKLNLVEPMLGSKQKFSELLKVFKMDGVGLAYARRLDFICFGKDPEDRQMLTDEMQRLQLNRTDNHFCCGTMFAVRACALRFLQDDRISQDIFPAYGRQQSHGRATMAHVYERLVPLAVQGQGYEYIPLYINGISRFFFRLQDHFVIDRTGEDLCKYLKLFGCKFLLEGVEKINKD